MRAGLLSGAMVTAFLPSGTAATAGGDPAEWRLEWTRFADLPDPVGLKGMYGGVTNGQVLLAGGSNFPVPQRAGGRKTFPGAIYRRAVASAPDATWETAVERLPLGLGEGASVTTPHGVVGIGGHDGTGPVAAVFLLRWNPVTRGVERTSLPELPEPVANAAAALCGAWLYVAGGEGRAGPRGTFWRLDLTQVETNPSAARWEVLPTWPGRPRFGGALAPLVTADGGALWWGGGIQGPARSQADYLRDAYIYLPESAQWRSVATLPRGVVLGVAVPAVAHRVLVLGGSDGHDFERMKELGETYRIPSDALLYDSRTNRWTVAGTMPLGLVGAAVAATDAGWLVAGGEYSPGLRTPAVHQLTLNFPSGDRPADQKGGGR